MQKTKLAKFSVELIDSLWGIMFIYIQGKERIVSK